MADATCTNVPWQHVRIPPFPQTALRVLQLAAKESVPMNQLSALVSADPAFASEVLTIVNSLVYAPRFPIHSILQALAVIGANHLQGVCLAVGVRGYLAQHLRQADVQAMWRHNLACAAVAELLATAGFLDRDVAFSCGVMHDIGRVALAVICHQQYAELATTFHGPSESSLEREREVFGVDHCEIGLRLVKEWRLPEDFEPMIARHHDVYKKGDPWTMAALIQICCRMADTAGFPAFQGVEPQPYPELVELLPEHERRHFFPDIESLRTEVGRKILAVELI